MYRCKFLTGTENIHTALCSLIHSASRRMSLASYGGDLFGKFFNNSVQRERKEINHFKVAENHVPENLEDEKSKEQAKIKAKEHVANITEVLERLHNGEDPRKMWGTLKDFLVFIGIQQSILHEKVLMRFMSAFHGSCHEKNKEMVSLAHSLHEVITMIKRVPLMLFSDPSHSDVSELKSGIARVLCAMALAAHEESMANEAHRIFEAAKSISTHTMQISGILCLEASVLNRMKRYNEACARARKAIKISSGKNCMGYFHTAHALASLDNIPQAIQVLDEGLASINDERRTKLKELKHDLVSSLKQEN